MFASPASANGFLLPLPPFFSSACSRTAGGAFTNFTVSHDSLNEMFLSGDIRYAAGSVADWKISLGRFLYPAYRAVFSSGAGTPWLSGVLSLVWVSLAVYLAFAAVLRGQRAAPCRDRRSFS